MKLPTVFRKREDSRTNEILQVRMKSLISVFRLCKTRDSHCTCVMEASVLMLLQKRHAVLFDKQAIRKLETRDISQFSISRRAVSC